MGGESRDVCNNNNNNTHRGAAISRQHTSSKSIRALLGVGFLATQMCTHEGGAVFKYVGGEKAFVVSSSGWRGFTRIIYAAYVWLSMFIGCDFGHSVVKIIPLCTFICQLVVNRAGGGIKHGGGSEFTSDLWSRTYK